MSTESGQILNISGTLDLASLVDTSVYYMCYTNEFISTGARVDHDLLQDFHFTTRNALSSTNSVHHVTFTEVVAGNFIY